MNNGEQGGWQFDDVVNPLVGTFDVHRIAVDELRRDKLFGALAYQYLADPGSVSAADYERSRRVLAELYSISPRDVDEQVWAVSDALHELWTDLKDR